MPSQVLDTCRTRLQRAQGLVKPEAVGLLIGIECSRIRDSIWMYLTSLVTTRIGVELVLTFLSAITRNRGVPSNGTRNIVLVCVNIYRNIRKRTDIPL